MSAPLIWGGWLFLDERLSNLRIAAIMTAVIGLYLVGNSGSAPAQSSESTSLKPRLTWSHRVTKFFGEMKHGLLLGLGSALAYAIGNARVSFATHNGVEVALFVNNVTNKLYRNFAGDNASIISAVEDVWARPRWFGGSLSYRF